MDWAQTYRSLTMRNWFILLILAGISNFLMNHSITAGIIAGGLVIIANFSMLQRAVQRSFSDEELSKSKKIVLILGFYLRFLALGLVIFFLIKSDWISPIGLVIGLSTVFLSVVSFGISNMIRTGTREAT